MDKENWLKTTRTESTDFKKEVDNNIKQATEQGLLQLVGNSSMCLLWHYMPNKLISIAAISILNFLRTIVEALSLLLLINPRG